jgi:hypothetical protein
MIAIFKGLVGKAVSALLLDEPRNLCSAPSEQNWRFWQLEMLLLPGRRSPQRNAIRPDHAQRSGRDPCSHHRRAASGAAVRSTVRRSP